MAAAALNIDSTLAMTSMSRYLYAAAEAAERHSIENPIDDVEQYECHREHPTGDLVDLACLLSAVRVEVARWLTSICPVFDHIQLLTPAQKTLI